MIPVTDPGTGLPARNEQICDAFFTNKPQGSGRGLAISLSLWCAWQPFLGHAQRPTGHDVSLDLATTSPTETAQRGNLIRISGLPSGYPGQDPAGKSMSDPLSSHSR